MIRHMQIELLRRKGPPMSRLDNDVKSMSLPQLRKEVMRLRRAFRKELSYTGNHRCWITLLEVLPEGKRIKPLSLSRDVFLGNCERYFQRNQ